MNAPEPDSHETQCLLRRIRDGDRAAFDRLFARHRAHLRRAIEMRLDAKLRARLDPSDVVQETQLEAFERLDDYLAREPMPFRVWLRRTAHQRLLKMRRQHVDAARRAVGRELPLPDRSSHLLASRLLAGGSTPSQQLDRRELARKVRQAITQLSALDREVLLMRFFEGMSDPEVAQILDLTPAAVNKRHGRALIRLHKILLQADGRHAS